MSMYYLSKYVRVLHNFKNYGHDGTDGLWFDNDKSINSFFIQFIFLFMMKYKYMYLWCMLELNS